MDSGGGPKKRQRKPRGRGLRTKTGCLTCRKRHKKCDELRPVCGPCAISTRDCFFPGPDDVLPGTSPRSSLAEGGNVRAENSVTDATASPNVASQPSVSVSADLSREVYAAPPQAPFPSGLPLPEGLQISGSPADTVNSELWTTDLASTKWLGLLATDAAQADSSFSLAPSPAPDAVDAEHRAALDAPAIFQSLARHDFERRAWQSDRDILLSSHEALLLRHFADRSAQWLDLMDAGRHFSTYAIRLALRNLGLMKAILALSAKHRAKAQDGGTHTNDLHNEWIRYYYETLHYIQEALTYNSYTHSEELLATAIVISAYEMLDEESDGQGNWKRHLKGVFWIQRSQDVNGGSGGMRQAVWWAWLRQDIWAAFREKRRCLSFWAPVKDFHELDSYGMARRAIYLLSQAVNYCADSRLPDPDPTASMKRRQIKDDLLGKLGRWRSFLGKEYQTLPTATSGSDLFSPLWIHPPQFGVALQAYSLAQILVTLYSPIPSGFNGYLKMQRSLDESVDTICGIAMELKDDGCQILSAQCLYGAGLCVQSPEKRDRIISLMEDCEARVGWAPMLTWRDDLRREWARAEKEMME